VSPPSPRRRGRPGKDLEEVLRAAVKLFNLRGYDFTSMNDLALELGISKAGIYHHIDSKEQLLELSINSALDGLTAAADEADALSVPAVERLEQLIRRSVLVLADRLEFVTLLLRVRGNTDAERDAVLRRRDFDARVTKLVVQAQAEGDVRADIDPAIAARLLFGMVNSLTEWYQPGRGSDEALADTVTALAFDGLRTR
jgi:AcrR family transcriptional regulator